MIEDLQRKYGKIQTKPCVAKFILDLIGFKKTRPIEHKSVLDPGCGKGVFLLEALERSLSRAQMHDICTSLWIRNITGSFVGYEIDAELCKEARDSVCNFLIHKTDIDESLAQSLAQRIVIQGDFLEWEPKARYDVIVGNPPYVRYDNLEEPYKHWLRHNYPCFRGRADLCVPFIQHALDLLSEEGRLAFICTNRFTLCNYGEYLRNLITKNYGITKMIDFTAVKPFDTSVSTYPWIFVFEHKKHKNVSFSQIKNVDQTNSSSSTSRLGWMEIDYNHFSKTPWRIPDPELTKLWNSIRQLNPLRLGDPEFGVNVKVGLATGADKIFINPPTEAQVEQELLMPFVLSRNLKKGYRICRTDSLLNTWDRAEPDKLINLNDWPKASRYLKESAGKLKSRYIAKKNPDQWYRLIDHLDPKLVNKEKLIFPSLRRNLEVYFDEGACIPHHNCYYAIKVSKEGPSLKAIGALLSSRIVDSLASVLSIRFNGRVSRLLKSSFLEIPMPEPTLMIERGKELESVFLSNDVSGKNMLAKELYRVL